MAGNTGRPGGQRGNKNAAKGGLIGGKNVGHPKPITVHGGAARNNAITQFRGSLKQLGMVRVKDQWAPEMIGHYNKHLSHVDYIGKRKRVQVHKQGSFEGPPFAITIGKRHYRSSRFHPLPK